MDRLLFQIQQLVMPLVGILPVWLLLFLLILLALRFKRIQIFRWLFGFGVGIALLFLLLRFVFLLSFPLGERNSLLQVTSFEILELPLYVTFRHGTFSVNHNQADVFLLKSKDVSEGYFLERNQYQVAVGNKRTLVDALVFKRRNEMNLFSQVLSENSLSIPSSYRGIEEYTLYDSVSSMDFSESASLSVDFSVFMSRFEIYLPRIAGNKRYSFQLESSEGKFYIPEGPTFIITKNTAYPINFPADFQQVEGNMYKREGSTDTIITMNISSRIPKSLEVISINEHNK